MKANTVFTKTANVKNNATVRPVTVPNVKELKAYLAPFARAKASVAIIDLPVYLLDIDTGYQTELRTERELNYLSRNWNENKLLPIVVVPHIEEGKAMIVDGYGRWCASQLVNPEAYKTLSCMVILNAPADVTERRKFEAELYAFQNKNVASMKPSQRHGAFEILEDRAALDIDKAREKYNFDIVKSRKGLKTINAIGSYSALYNIAKNEGYDCLGYIFDVCKAARFNEEPAGYSRGMMRSLKDVYKLYPNNRTETKEFLSNYLRKTTPITLKAEAVVEYKEINEETALTKHLEDIVVSNLNLKQMRAVSERKLKDIVVVPASDVASGN